MDSPKSYKHKEKRVSYKRREHKNKKFYNSTAWRETRDAYMRHYQARLFREIPMGKWAQMDIDNYKLTYLMSKINKDFLPCETCLKLFIADAYEDVEKGVELDHIQPVNPKNALNRILTGAEAIETKIVPGLPDEIEVKLNYFYGDPFSFDNLQLLCKTHHAKKSQRER